MKAGNVIFVIFLWIVLFPALLVFSALGFFGSMLGGYNSGGICFILIPIIFIILTIIILLRPEKPPYVIQGNSVNQRGPEYHHYNNSESKVKRRCPKCGRSIPEDSITCPYCRHDFEKQPKYRKKVNELFDDPIRILNIRYSKGEITKEEYEKMKKDIEEK